MTKKCIVFSVCAFLFLSPFAVAQEDITFVDPLTEAGENLDLYAVMALLKAVETVEDFEKARAWYNSEEYKVALALRLESARTNIVFIDGL